MPLSVSLNLRTGTRQAGSSRKKTGGGGRLEVPQAASRLMVGQPGSLHSQLTSAPALEAQVRLIRAARLAEPGVARYLVAVFYAVEDGSPFRKAISATFNHCPAKEQSLVADAIAEFLLADLSDANLVSWILLSQAQCKPAREALVRTAAQLLPAVVQHLNSAFQELRSNYPNLHTSARSALQDRLGDSARAIVALIATLPKDAPSHYQELVEPFTSAVVPMDTKANIALYFVAQLEDDSDFFSTQDISWLTVVMTDVGAYVSYCQALLIKLPRQSLMTNEGAFFRDIFRRIAHILKSYRDLNVPTHLQASRCFLQFASRLPESLDHLTEADFKQLCLQMEDHCWSLLDSSVDSIRHSGKNALKHLLLAALERSKLFENEKDYIKDFLRRYHSVSWSEKKKYAFLTIACKTLGTDLISVSRTTFSTDILNHARNDLTITSHCYDLYEVCLKNASKSDASWMSQWITPLFSSPSSVGLARLQKIAMELDPAVIKLALQGSPSTWRTISSEQVHVALNVALIAIRLKKIKEGVKWKEYITLPALQIARTFFEAEVRRSALETLITCRSSNEIFIQDELTMALELITSLLSLENPSEKQAFIMLMKKLFGRINEGLCSSLRHNVDGSLQLEYSSFVKNLLDVLVIYLDKEASRNTCIECLSLYTSHFRNVDFFMKVFADCHGLLKSLDACIREDSYDRNREAAVAILKQFPSALKALCECRTLWNSITSTFSSINPSTIDSVNHLMALLMEQKDANILFPTNSRELLKTKLLRHLTEILNGQLARAKSNLQQAASDAPMYGVLLAMRSVIESVGQSSARDVIQPVLPGVLEVCHEVAAAVAPVITSETPEGLCLGSDDDGDAQKLLLCTWRSSREVSLILGALINLLPVDVTAIDKSNSLFDISDISRVSNFFMEQLERIKHRGAFEQAYVGFCSLCSFMWLSNDTRIQSQLYKIVRDTLDAVRNRNASLCVTRRSAGVPFLIQGIVSSEPESTLKSSLFHETMDTLLTSSLLQDSSETDDECLQVRVHARNILRALVRNNKLGEKICPYLERTVVSALEGFKASVWAERNSATLLFSALVTRIFGVKRDSDEFSERNSTMTTRLFFQRYPNLYSIFLKKLNDSAKIVNASEGTEIAREASLFPVLIVLAKLHRAPFSTGPDEYQVDAFKESLLALTGSSVISVRQLAARAFIKLHLYQNEAVVGKRAFSLSESIEKLFPRREKRLRQNELHGRLILVNRILQDCKYSPADVDQFLQVLHSHVLYLNKKEFPYRDSCMVKCAAIEVVLAVLQETNEGKIPQELLSYLFSNLDDSDVTAFSAPWRPFYVRVATRLKAELAFKARFDDRAVVAACSSTSPDEVLGFLDAAEKNTAMILEYWPRLIRYMDHYLTAHANNAHSSQLLSRLFSGARTALPLMAEHQIESLLELLDEKQSELSLLENDVWIKLSCDVLMHILINDQHGKISRFLANTINDFVVKKCPSSAPPSDTLAEIVRSFTDNYGTFKQAKGLVSVCLWNVIFTLTFMEHSVQVNRELMELLRKYNPVVISVLPLDLGPSLYVASLEETPALTSSTQALWLFKMTCERRLQDEIMSERANEDAQIVFERGSYELTDSQAIRDTIAVADKLLANSKISPNLLDYPEYLDYIQGKFACKSSKEAAELLQNSISATK